MGSAHWFLGVDDDIDQVRRWFRDLPDAPVETATSAGAILYFPSFGPVVYAANSGSEIDPKRSPVANLLVPRRRRGALWTAGELHFLPTPAAAYPRLHAISRRFRRWLARFDLVFSQTSKQHEWDYYLEGTIRNKASEVFALPRAMAVLRNGGYFISDGESDAVLETLRKTLRLRGVDVLPADA